MLSSIVITPRDRSSECRLVFNEGLNLINANAADTLFSKLDDTKKRRIIMLAIDYAFGGEDFSNRRRNPAILAVGEELNLEIHFEFQNSTHSFIRSTDESNVVYEDYGKYSPWMSLREYQRHLCEMYNIENTDGFTFYGIVGRFFRMNISGRDNLQINSPLHARKGERAATPIRILEILFSRPSGLVDARNELYDLNIEKGTYDNAVHYGLINIDNPISISSESTDSNSSHVNNTSLNQDSYRDIMENSSNDAQIQSTEGLYTPYIDSSYSSEKNRMEYWKKPEVEKARYAEARMKNEYRKKELSDQKQKAIHELDDGITRKLDDIDKETVVSKRKLAMLYAQKLTLQSQINTINANINSQDNILPDDIARIRRFFPNADLQHIEDVNNFHHRIGNILSSEMQEESSKLSAMLSVVEDEISKITNVLKSQGELVNISSDGMLKFEKIISESAINDEQYKRVVKGEEIQNNYERVEMRLSEEQNSFYNMMTETINSSMSEFSSEDNYGNWIFELNTYQNNSHNLYKHGGGQGYEGLIAFDLALLNNTVLPIVLHDEEMFTQMYDNSIKHMVKCYERCTKQTFVNLGKNEYHNS